MYIYCILYIYNYIYYTELYYTGMYMWNKESENNHSGLIGWNEHYSVIVQLLCTQLVCCCEQCSKPSVIDRDSHNG